MDIAPVGLKIEGYEPNNCSCTACKTMCLSSPCFPTPEEVVRLDKMGFGSDLMFTMFMIQENVLGEIVGVDETGIATIKAAIPDLNRAIIRKYKTVQITIVS